MSQMQLRFACLSVAAALAVAAPAYTAPAGTPALATDEQLAAEEQLRILSVDPDVLAAQKSLTRSIRASSPIARTPDGGARLDHAVRLWANSLIYREIAGDPERPVILWTTDNTPHRWFGKDVPATGAAGDNPDHIYRNTFVDGAGRYEILGQVNQAHRPTSFNFEMTLGTPGSMAPRKAGSNASANTPDIGNQLAVLTNQTVKVAPDGTFRITLGTEKASPDHLVTRPEPITLIIRDIMSDWTQVPMKLSLKRLDKPMGQPASNAVIKQRFLKDISEWVNFWAEFPNVWLGGVKPNTSVGPIARDGGWAYMAGVHFLLTGDQVTVINIERGDAPYIGVQVTDGWLIAPDGKSHLTSYNTAQAVPNGDGSYTYIVSPKDPGVSNWVDSGGLKQGYAIVRWQSLKPGKTADGLLKSVRFESLAKLKAAGMPGVPTATPAQRKAQLAKRVADYDLRLQSR